MRFKLYEPHILIATSFKSSKKYINWVFLYWYFRDVKVALKLQTSNLLNTKITHKSYKPIQSGLCQTERFLVTGQNMQKKRKMSLRLVFMVLMTG